MAFGLTNTHGLTSKQLKEANRITEEANGITQQANNVIEEAKSETDKNNVLNSGEPTEEPTLTSSDGSVAISYTDPEDINIGEDASLWTYGGTVIVRKEGSAPSSANDGVVVLNTTTRDEYSTTPFIDTGDYQVAVGTYVPGVVYYSNPNGTNVVDVTSFVPGVTDVSKYYTTYYGYTKATGNYVSGTIYYADPYGYNVIDTTGFTTDTNVSDYYVIDSSIGYVQASGKYVPNTIYYSSDGTVIDTTGFTTDTDVSSYYVSNAGVRFVHASGTYQPGTIYYSSNGTIIDTTGFTSGTDVSSYYTVGSRSGYVLTTGTYKSGNIYYWSDGTIVDTSGFTSDTDVSSYYIARPTITNGKAYYYTVYSYSDNNVYRNNGTTYKKIPNENQATVSLTSTDNSTSYVNGSTISLNPTNLQTVIKLSSNSNGKITVKTDNDNVDVIYDPEDNTITIKAVNNGNSTITISQEDGDNVTAPNNITLNIKSSLFNKKTVTATQIKEAVCDGTISTLYSVGDSIPITLNGQFGNITFNNETYYATILGFNHNKNLETPTETNSVHFTLGKNANGVDIAFAEYPFKTFPNYFAYHDLGWKTTDHPDAFIYPQSTNASWEQSRLRNVVCPAFLNVLPTEWKNNISTIKKYGNNGTTENYRADNITATDEQIWLLSANEIYGTDKTHVDASGYRANVYETEKNYQQQYDYYKNGNTDRRRHYQYPDYNHAIYYYLRTQSRSGSFLSARGDELGSINTVGNERLLAIAPCFAVAGNQLTMPYFGTFEDSRSYLFLASNNRTYSVNLNNEITVNTVYDRVKSLSESALTCVIATQSSAPMSIEVSSYQNNQIEIRKKNSYVNQQFVGYSYTYRVSDVKYRVNSSGGYDEVTPWPPSLQNNKYVYTYLLQASIPENYGQNFVTVHQDADNNYNSWSFTITRNVVQR